MRKITLVAALGLMIAPGALAAGCTGEVEDQPATSPGAAGEGEGEVGEAAQPLSSAICVTLQRGGLGGAVDTRLRLSNPTTAYGTQNTLVTGNQTTKRIVLLGFDLSPVPVGVYVTSADVILDEVSNLGPSTVAVHAVTAPWSEATATWNSFNNAYAAATITSFSNGGAGHTGPVSFSISSLAQGWVNGAANRGMALLATTNSTWASSEATVVAQRPALKVCYLPPGCTPEVCDGIDNDCNGLVDEGFNVGASCSAGVGACAAAGTIACNGSGGAACNAVPGAPKAEACDGIDNNCNGQVDEGFGTGAACSAGVGACLSAGTIVCNGPSATKCSAVAGSPTAEVCDGVDNNCDGQVDESFKLGVSCSVGFGACAAAGKVVCNGSGGVSCNGVPGTPQAEICDGIDNDCNGLVDEPFGVGTPCSAGSGTCVSYGMVICNGSGGTRCTAIPSAPQAEVCDGIDNNCNGQVDEGLGVGVSCSVGVGACRAYGAMACNGAGGTTCSAVAGTPTLEVCDGVDNNCDGQVDEGVCPGPSATMTCWYDINLHCQYGPDQLASVQWDYAYQYPSGYTYGVPWYTSSGQVNWGTCLPPIPGVAPSFSVIAMAEALNGTNYQTTTMPCQ